MFQVRARVSGKYDYVVHVPRAKRPWDGLEGLGQNFAQTSWRTRKAKRGLSEVKHGTVEIKGRFKAVPFVYWDAAKRLCEVNTAENFGAAKHVKSFPH